MKSFATAIITVKRSNASSNVKYTDTTSLHYEGEKDMYSLYIEEATACLITPMGLYHKIPQMSIYQWNQHIFGVLVFYFYPEYQQIGIQQLSQTVLFSIFTKQNAITYYHIMQYAKLTEYGKLVLVFYFFLWYNINTKQTPFVILRKFTPQVEPIIITYWSFKKG